MILSIIICFILLRWYDHLLHYLSYHPLFQRYCIIPITHQNGWIILNTLYVIVYTLFDFYEMSLESSFLKYIIHDTQLGYLLFIIIHTWGSTHIYIRTSPIQKLSWIFLYFYHIFFNYHILIEIFMILYLIFINRLSLF